MDRHMCLKCDFVSGGGGCVAEFDSVCAALCLLCMAAVQFIYKKELFLNILSPYNHYNKERIKYERKL